MAEGYDSKVEAVDWHYHPAVDVVIPLRNSASCFPGLAEEILRREDFSRWFEPRFLLVDDASTDSTWEEIQRLSDDYPGRFRALRLRRRGGQQLATLAGILHSAGDHVVTMDDDGQHDWADVRRLLAPVLNRGALLSYGVPREDRRPWPRRAGARLYRRIVAATYGVRFFPVTSFRCLSGSLRDQLSRLEAVRGWTDVSLLRLAERVETIEVDSGPGRLPRSRHSLADLLLVSICGALPIPRNFAAIEREIADRMG